MSLLDVEEFGKYDDDDVINEWDPCYIIGDMAHSILVDFF